MGGKSWLLWLVAATACGPRELRVTMNADNNSEQAGFATLVDRGSKGMTVTVEVSSPDFQGPQNAHIHDGNCGEVGVVHAALEQLVALPNKPGRVGSTTEVTNVTFATLKTGDWIINAHHARDNSLYVSCGEIPRP